MQANAFINKPNAPTREELAAALGPAWTLWDQLVADLAKENGVDVQEWKSYSLKHGWSLRLMRKKRNILYLSPGPGSFRVMFIFGDKAMRAAREVRLPRKILKIIDEAPRYPEGTGIRIEVTGIKDIEAIKKLAAIKLES